jgi:hypothetical protein
LYAQWYKYHTAEEIETSGSFFSDSHTFTGDGYVTDFSLHMSTDEFVSEFVKLLNDEKPHDNTAERILHHKKTRLAGDSVKEFERTPQ